MDTSELEKQMKARGISNPFDLTETDQWVNDATRKDIETIAAQHDWKVFGLEMWTWHMMRGKALQGARNFSVDYLFKNKDAPKVLATIQEYKETSKEGYSKKLTEETVNKLSHLALDTCIWV